MGAGERIIVVDDDPSVRDAVADYLERQGYDVQRAGGGEELDALLDRGPPDLLILDVMMPGEDGIAICRRLSVRGLRILMLSAAADPCDRIIGLEIGADDYLVKPFEPRELLARVRALLRRGDNAAAGAGPIFMFGGWRYDASARVLQHPARGGVYLTAAEHLLLTAFLERPGRVLSRDQIIHLTRGPGAEAFDRAVDLAVSRLRRKLEGDGARLIETVRGDGYRFHAGVRRA
jgi:two-component system OmpR family response regulator